MERYIYGALFGMIAEYCYRVHCGVIQLFLLFTLIIIFIIDIFQQFKKNNMKQSAVSWLIQNIVEDQTIKAKPMSEWLEIFEQAKSMEKHQIVNAFKEGLRSPYHQDYTIVTQEGQEGTKSGQYYNETYGDDK